MVLLHWGGVCLVFTVIHIISESVVSNGCVFSIMLFISFLMRNPIPPPFEFFLFFPNQLYPGTVMISSLVR